MTNLPRQLANRSLGFSPQRRKMAEREGFEPSPPAPPSVNVSAICESGEAQSSPIASPNIGNVRQELSEIVETWPTLPESIRSAILALLRAAKGGVK